MAQKIVAPAIASTFDDRGVATTSGVDKNMRKTGYRPDAKMTATTNSNDPDVLVRDAVDPRLA
jgi:hypothetical protein